SYLALFLIVLALLGLELFDRYLSSEKGTRWYYQDLTHQPLSIQYTSSGLRYLSIGEADKPPLVLVHGAPGSCMDWKGFALFPQIYDHYRLLIVERPGYGGTRPRGAEKSIETQARRILEVLADETQAAVVMGHSYGGPVAMVMAALSPEKIAQVIGVAGAYSPDHEVTFAISHYVKFGIFKYLLPRMLWVSNVEKLSHPASLRAIEPFYEKIKVPVVLLHSTIDRLVPYENATYLIERLSDDAQLLTWQDVAHPVQMNQPQLLIDFLLKQKIVQ
ncbi:MAG: alpha/beta hydrolase, partial [Bacteroidota bacterium]